METVYRYLLSLDDVQVTILSIGGILLIAAILALISDYLEKKEEL